MEQYQPTNTFKIKKEKYMLTQERQRKHCQQLYFPFQKDSIQNSNFITDLNSFNRRRFL